MGEKQMSISLIWAVCMSGDLHWVILIFLRLYTSLKNPLNIYYLCRIQGESRFFVPHLIPKCCIWGEMYYWYFGKFFSSFIEHTIEFVT